jgi:HTH-type transcriptional regulator, transcriptional repressor of NAD biosynthesis genes
MTTGLIVGKFNPPHKGHSFLIESALSQVDELTVIVCDHPSQNIRGEIRAAWLREIHPQISVIVVPDTLGDDYQAWTQFTIATLGRAPDMVFTSENYGDAFSRFLGSRHILVDRDRRHVPISATMVRQDPLAHWDFLAPAVRAFFAKRVCLVGAESTGKTTMATALARHYRTSWVPEFGRTYWEGKFPSENLRHWQTQEFIFIAQKQIEMEDQLARTCNKILICDTDAFSTNLWHERYLGKLPPEVTAVDSGASVPAADARRSQPGLTTSADISRNRKIDLYLLTDTDIPFTQDGIRDGEQIRSAMHLRFLKQLGAQNKPFLLLSGSHESRLATAIAACETLLHFPSPLTYV